MATWGRAVEPGRGEAIPAPIRAVSDSSAERPVNVASVPQRSPFRYPGGKTWLVPRIRQWLGGRPEPPAVLVEPFAGGGIVGLTAAFEGLARRVVLVELDEQVAAVWETILAEGGEDGGRAGADWLAERILTFDLTTERVRAALAAPAPTRRERAFQTILKNRVYRGGILAPGSGLVKHGEAGRGPRSRWYPETLARRIRDIAARADRIAFRQGDGLAVMAEYADRPDVAFFIDPPYTAGRDGKRAGRRLYTHNDLDHAALFALAARVAGDLLLTYDDDAEVRALAERHGLVCRSVPMKTTHHAELRELLITRPSAAHGRRLG